jgi:O-antigen/teichoic acid export membrane protein
MRNKQIRGGIILSGLSQIISIIVGLVYQPIMIGYLGQSEYGLYQLVLSLVNYLNLMNFGFNGAYIRFYTLAKSKGEDEVSKVNGMFLTVFLFIAILCIGVGTVLYFNIGILGNQLTAEDYAIARKLLVLMVFNVAISFPNSLYIAYMSAESEFIKQKAWNIIINILTPILNLPLLKLGFGSVGVVTVSLALTIFRFFVNVFVCKADLHMKTKYFYFDKIIFKSLLGYTFFIFLSDLVDQLNSNVDKFLLGRIMGTIAVAVYSVGFNLKNYYTQATWVIPEMYIPEVNRLAIDEKNDDKLTALFTKIGRYNNYIVLLIITGFALIGREFIFLWVGNEYAMSYYAGLILMLAGYIPAVQTLGVNIQNAKNLHQMRSIVYFFVACVNVILSIGLIHKWGVVGTCLGTLFATLAGHGLFMNYYYKKYVGLNIYYFWKTLAKWYPFAIVIYLFGLLVTKVCEINSWKAIILFVIVYVIVYGILLLLFGLNDEERSKIKYKMQKIRRQ